MKSRTEAFDNDVVLAYSQEFEGEIYCERCEADNLPRHQFLLSVYGEERGVCVVCPSCAMDLAHIASQCTARGGEE